MAAPEDIPRNPDNSIVSYTWSENPDTAVEPSAGRKDTGWLAGDTVTQGEMNWLEQTPARFSRAQWAEAMRASSSLVGSWLYPGTVNPIEGLGTWSETGVINPLEGFLSDAVGTGSRAVDVWVDPDGNGAKGLQVKVSLASPVLFTAISDNYVYLDTTEAEAGLGGGMTIIAVPNGNPAPATPGSTVLFWIVITDASNITGQSIEAPTIPVFKTVLIDDLTIESLAVTGNTALGDDPGDSTSVTGSLSVKGTETILNVPSLSSGLTVTGAGDAPAITVDGDADLGLAVQASGALPAIVGTNLGTGQGVFAGATDASTCGLKAENSAGCAVDAVGAGSAPALKAETTGTGSGATVTNDDATSAALVVTNSNAAGPGLDMQSSIIVATGKSIGLGANTTILGTNTTVATFGEVNFLSGGGPLSAVGLGVNAGGELFFGVTNRVHSSPQAYVYATGDQEAETALQALVTFATTTQAVTGRGAGNVRIIVEGWGQRSTLGDVVVTVQQDQGTATWIAVGSTQTVEWIDTGNANLWSPFRHERTINIGTSTATFFRAQANPTGGATAKVRESHLRVVPERF